MSPRWARHLSVSSVCLSVTALHALLGSAGAESMDTCFLQFLASRILVYILFQELTCKIWKKEEKRKAFSQWQVETRVKVGMQLLTVTPVGGTSRNLAVAVGPDLRDSWCCLFSSRGNGGPYRWKSSIVPFLL